MVKPKAHARKTVALALMASLLLPHLLSSPASAAVTPIESPSERILVVTANLQEAYDRTDVADHTDMNLFVERALSLLPYAPDALLLQEITQASGDHVAQRLRAETGYAYKLVVDPGTRVLNRTSRRSVHMETGIILNTTTMAAVDAGGFATTSYKRSQAAKGTKPSVKNNAYMLAEERSSGLRLPLASVHFALRSKLRTLEISDRKRRQWSIKMADLFAASYAAEARQLNTIGGDFNGARCLDTSGDCVFSKFWRTLTGDVWHYRDTVRHVIGKGASGIDLIFSHGGVYDAGIDSSYDPRGAAGDTDLFYSDHRFRWALLGSDVMPPTAPSGLRARSGNIDVDLTWTASIDSGDSGLAGYEVWRAGSSGDFRLMGKTPTTSFRDDKTYRGKTYTYRVVAYDGARNRSEPSSTVKISPYLKD